MPEKNERYDAFAVPRNFGEDGISFNGLSRRNLAEGCILAAATGYPIAFHLSADLSLRIIYRFDRLWRRKPEPVCGNGGTVPFSPPAPLLHRHWGTGASQSQRLETGEAIVS